MRLSGKIIAWWNGYTPADRESLAAKLLAGRSLTPGGFTELTTQEFAALMADNRERQRRYRERKAKGEN